MFYSLTIIYFFSALNFSIHSFSNVFFYHLYDFVTLKLEHSYKKKRTNAGVFFICECKANGDLLANEFQIKSQENTKIKNNKEKEMREKKKMLNS